MPHVAGQGKAEEGEGGTEGVNERQRNGELQGSVAAAAAAAAVVPLSK